MKQINLLSLANYRYSLASAHAHDTFRRERSTTILTSAPVSNHPIDVYRYNTDSPCDSESSLSPERVFETPTSCSAAGMTAILLEGTSEVIGFVVRKGELKCNQTECSFSKFSRATELKRHYNSFHNPDKSELWCPVPGCRRSKGVRGGKSFQRKDKRKDHMVKKHKDVAFQGE